MNLPELSAKFIDRYHHAPTASFFGPGRVNLIGEHIDYNGGMVMPCAITAGTWLLLAPNNLETIRMESLNFQESLTLPIFEKTQKNGNLWYNYVLGVINELQSILTIHQGVDLLFFGNLPIGAGLSSSASLTVLTTFALVHHFNINIDKLEVVKIAKRVENNFIGVNCGIMDQFSVAFAKKDQALMLNCNTLAYEQIPFKLNDFQLAIINTNKSRKLEESKYNERVSECQSALKSLNAVLNIEHLCELDAERLAIHKHLINDKIVLKRAQHVVEENDRVQLAAKAMREGQLEEFGKLMFASHHSLSKLYEVSGQELDCIVNFCEEYPQVIGARMTGAGFGGCAIALVKKGFENDFTKELTKAYESTIGYPPTIYFFETEAGAHQIHSGH